jgi:hypothetical protein
MVAVRSVQWVRPLLAQIIFHEQLNEEHDVQKLVECTQWERVDLPSIPTIIEAFEQGMQVSLPFITWIVLVGLLANLCCRN